VDPNYAILQPVELGGVPAPKLKLRSVYTLYTSQFRRWFGITAPTSLIASVVLLMADQRIRAIYRSIPRREIPYHLSEIAETVVLRYGGFFIAWFLGCFALAAVATAVNGLDSGDDREVWTSDSFQRAREHFGRLFLAALVTFGMFSLGMAAVLFVEVTLFRKLGWAQFSRYNNGAAFLGTLIIANIVSWFGMAIPLVLWADVGVWAALKRSLRLSNGYETLLSMLVFESAVGSFVAWYAVHYGLTFLFPLHFRSMEWYGWLVYFVSILASAAVQPPMFIGFSMLAADGHGDPPLPSNPHQPAQVH
jgi:hypothetical protein